MDGVNDTIISTPATTDALDEDLVLDLRDVTLVRDGRHLLHPVTWQVEVDERWIVIGPNGAGKTSLLTIAGAREYPSSGTARIVGETLGRTDVRELRTAVGMSSAAIAHQIPGDERVLDLVISAGYDVMGRWREVYESADEVRAMEILEQMGALHLGDQIWGTLSEGERKRVLIARALMNDPELLLLDEPGAGLDLGGREDLVSQLGELAGDPDAPAMVMVTHHVEEIPPGFTHGLILDEGHVVAQGLLEDVMTSENLTRAYHQPISLTVDEDRYFARRTRRGGSHRA
ncbi:MAG TPA: ABC transporter ATP-binding protein [Candidatus Corynebacterium avicola]|uniref:ABC transporter ATP-binding protein n=1 Tax=Candidatus Corynebacterium avicola TaxID=2838527 RepID=A0A9D1ULA4_9CORY|nr:ABC transporter ATP-binding protein [Candidatus Corynebacterium avicola]